MKPVWGWGVGGRDSGKDWPQGEEGMMECYMIGGVLITSQPSQINFIFGQPCLLMFYMKKYNALVNFLLFCYTSFQKTASMLEKNKV